MVKSRLHLRVLARVLPHCRHSSWRRTKGSRKDQERIKCGVPQDLEAVLFRASWIYPTNTRKKENSGRSRIDIDEAISYDAPSVGCRHSSTSDSSPAIAPPQCCRCTTAPVTHSYELNVCKRSRCVFLTRWPIGQQPPLPGPSPGRARRPPSCHHRLPLKAIIIISSSREEAGLEEVHLLKCSGWGIRWT